MSDEILINEIKVYDIWKKEYLLRIKWEISSQCKWSKELNGRLE